MSSILLSLSLLLAPSGTALPVTVEEAPGGPVQNPTDGTLQKAWKNLPAEEKAEIVQWFRAECDRRRSLARQLERHVFHSLPSPRGTRNAWSPQPVYDSSKHCPAQPIPRKVLAPENPKTQAERKRLGLTSISPPPAWVYDWASGKVLQTREPFAPEHIFELALAGRAPEQDMAVALIQQFLDKGTLRSIHRAFSHTYATREGRAYGGISLYDAWSSGVKIEMPDVECLGIIHDVDRDWTSFVAPVPGPQQKPLYDRIGLLFHSVRRERSLAEALALSYFEVEPILDPTYEGAKERLQLFWSKHDSGLEESQAALPASSEWDSWWETIGQMQADDDLGEKAALRRTALGSEKARVRGIMVWVLKEWGALE